MTIDRSLGHTGWGLADAELFQGQSLPTRVRAPRPRISLERPVISCHGCAQLPCFGVALSSLQQRTIHGLQSLRPAFAPSSPPQRCPRAQQHPRQGWSGDNASLEHMRQQSGIKRDGPSSPSCLACVVWLSCIAIARLLLAMGRAPPTSRTGSSSHVTAWEELRPLRLCASPPRREPNIPCEARTHDPWLIGPSL